MVAGYNNIEKMVETLTLIPFDKWREIVRLEPEYDFLKALKETYGFGQLATIAVVTGLNDYQTKKEPETNYWPVLKNILEGKQEDLKTPQDLIKLLNQEFYKKDRLNKVKMERTEKFLTSTLAKQLWDSSPEWVEKKYKEIWLRLGYTMSKNKEINKKTIVFAMKVFGILLMLYGYEGFDTKGIPVPVDKRVKEITEKITKKEMRDDDIRIFWNKVIEEVRKKHPRFSFIELDSLLWQLNKLDTQGIQTYFTALGMPWMTERILSLLGEKM